jgi:hypothetical protein
MLSRTVRAGAVGFGRRMSSVTATGPAAQIATNVAVLEAMSGATDEAGLSAAKSATAAAAGASSTGAAAAEAYKPDPTAWQNMAMGDYVAAEAGRSDFMPFVIGGVVTYILLGVMLPAALPSEGKKNSKYVNLTKGIH